MNEMMNMQQVKSINLRKPIKQFEKPKQAAIKKNINKQQSAGVKKFIKRFYALKVQENVQKPDQFYWHKRSVSMKMKTFNYLQHRIPKRGFFIKFRKNKQIYSFRCFRLEEINEKPQIQLAADNDIDTDDEQIYLAQRTLFYNLCGSVQQEIMKDAEEQNKNSDETQVVYTSL